MQDGLKMNCENKGSAKINHDIGQRHSDFNTKAKYKQILRSDKSIRFGYFSHAKSDQSFRMRVNKNLYLLFRKRSRLVRLFFLQFLYIPIIIS